MDIASTAPGTARLRVIRARTGRSGRFVASALIAVSQAPLSAGDRDILAGISVMVLAIANRQNLADQEQDDEMEGVEPAPCGSPSKDEPARYCLREPGHSGRHKYRPINGLAN